jgi:hypothetical protein
MLVVLVASSKGGYFLSTVDEEATNLNKFWAYLILYSSCVPISVYGILDLLYLFQKSHIENSFT